MSNGKPMLLMDVLTPNKLSHLNREKIAYFLGLCLDFFKNHGQVAIMRNSLNLLKACKNN